MLREANIDLNDCFFTNVVSIQPRGNQMETLFYKTKDAELEGRRPIHGCYPRMQVLDGVTNLLEQIKQVKPKLIIGLGNYTLWALTEDCFEVKDDGGRKVPTGISNYRGSQLHTADTKTPFLPTYHPAATFKTYAWRAMIKHDLKVRVPKALEKSWKKPKRQYIIRPAYEEVCMILRNLYDEASIQGSKKIPMPFKIAVDLETRGNYIACIGLAWQKNAALCIPILTTDKGKKPGYWDLEEELSITLRLRDLFQHPNVELVGQNFSFDIQYIFHQMFFLPHVSSDTMLKHHVCFPGGGDPVKGTGPQGLVQKSLNHLSSLYCDHHRYWKAEGKTWETWMPEEQLWSYNCLDCCVTYEVDEKLNEVVTIKHMWDQYRFQMAQLNELAIPMMLRGVKIDLKTRNLMIMDMLDAVAKFEHKIAPMVPKDMLPVTAKGASPWYKSPKQLAHIFYEELGIKPVFSDLGRPTTGKKALPILAKREPIIKPIIDTLGTLRSLNVFYGTFLNAALDPDDRMRCSFNVSGTDTFRWSSSTNVFERGANLQNIPDGEANTRHSGVQFPNIRNLFIPDSGYIICDADLSGADAAVVAWETEEEDFKIALKKGIKLHSVVAKELYGTDEQPHYDMCKRRIHATNYAGGYRTIHQTLAGLYGNEFTSEKIERDFQDWWFNRYPGVKRWHDRVQQSLKDTGGVKNKFGNRILFQDRIDSVFNKALAWIPQSTVALVTVRGGLAIKRKFKFIQILMQVHDSIIFQLPSRERKHLPEITETLNSITVPYDDPLRIPWVINTSDKSWGDCK